MKCKYTDEPCGEHDIEEVRCCCGCEHRHNCKSICADFANECLCRENSYKIAKACAYSEEDLDDEEYED